MIIWFVVSICALGEDLTLQEVTSRDKILMEPNLKKIFFFVFVFSCIAILTANIFLLNS